MVDRESAFEKLQAKLDRGSRARDRLPPPRGLRGREEPGNLSLGKFGISRPHFSGNDRAAWRVHETMATSMIKSVMRSAGTQVGHEIMRGVVGGILGGGTMETLVGSARLQRAPLGIPPGI